MPLAITSYDMVECRKDVEMVKRVGGLTCLEGPISNPFGSMIFYPNPYYQLNQLGMAAYREHDGFALLVG